MDHVDVYDVWVGNDNAWEIWTKPSPFAQMKNETSRADAPEGHQYRGRSLPWSDIDVSWAPDVTLGTFILVDIEGASSVALGFTLMSRGYRPVVAINTCTGPDEVLDMNPVLDALREGARFAHAFPRQRSAPPAFLLDARRMSTTRPLVPGAFDNRWMIFRQDLPSADLLRSRKLSRVVVVLCEDTIADDLRHVLYAWQKGGIEILVKYINRESPAEPVTIQSPSWLRRIWGQPAGAEELLRNAQGSFGARIPEPSHG